MKKLMLALLVGLMVVGATASMAAAEITVGGTLETRYDLWYNLAMDNSELQRSQNFFAERILLDVDAKIAEGLEAYVELATDANGIDERTWGAQSALNAGPVLDADGDLTHVGNSTRAIVSATNHHGETLAIRQAWVNFMIPGIPVGVKIGHQPLALGHGIFLDSHRLGQDAILAYSKPIPELLVAGVYVKGLEQSNTNPQNGPSFDSHMDVDIYAALANYTFMPNNTVGVFYLYGHDAANAGLALNGSFTLPPAATTINNGIVGYLHNVGVVADGVIGPMNYKFEADYQDISAHTGPVTGLKDRLGANHSFALMGGAGANVMNMVNVGLEAAYGSGDNINKQNGVSFISTQGNFIGNRVYNNPYGTTSYNYAFLYNDKIGQGADGAGGGLGLGDGTGGFGLANTSYIKLSASVTPMAKLTAGMDVLYLRATGDHIVPVEGGVEKIGRSRNLGWEVDAHADYKIYDNLNLNLTGGVFLPGQWYDDALIFEGSSHEASTAYGVETKLTCKF